MGIPMYNFIEKILIGKKVHYPKGSDDIYTIITINSVMDSANIANAIKNRWVYLMNTELVGDNKNYEIEE